MGARESRIETVAQYVRTLNLLHDFIQQIAQDVFRDPSEEVKQLLKDSIDSYNINFVPAIINDPIESKLLNTPMYRHYMENICNIHGITFPFYDMRGCTTELDLSTHSIGWIKRRKAIICTFSDFTLLAKKNVLEPFTAHTESIIQPDCK